MEAPDNEHECNYVKRTVTVIAPGIHRLVNITKPTRVTQAWSERDITISRTKKLAGRKLLNNEHHAPVHN
ncbi:hypothetical protein FEP54_04701 [Burkholderia multivorans]|nr:hypothetical protein [Burkholderia multivorans]MDR8925968.1 hypothetical protein [Burkholderia multivorans]MDR8967205.1 hypothetical protein [Burkholderia multivorans]MDR8993020.1 hypothetical protein [Burkholderia multivorans]MDR9023322.1 hypothetical protein [Burkholderia multivorans]